MKKLLLLVGIIGLIGCSESNNVEKEIPYLAGLYQVTKGGQTITVNGVVDGPGCLIGAVIGVGQTKDIVSVSGCMGVIEENEEGQLYVQCEGEYYDYSQDYGLNYQYVVGELTFDGSLLHGIITTDMNFPQVQYTGSVMIDFTARFEEEYTNMCTE